MITDLQPTKANIIPRPWLTPQRRNGSSTVFDRYFPGDFDRSDLQLAACKRAVQEFFRALRADALKFLAKEFSAGNIYEWTSASDVAATLARYLNTDRLHVIEQYQLHERTLHTYWFAQIERRPGCEFTAITLSWIDEVLAQKDH